MQVNDQLTGPLVGCLGVYIGCFLKCWVSSTNPWVFLLKMIILGCEMGVPPFKETPIDPPEV